MTLFYPDVSNNQWSSNQDVVNFLSQLAQQGFAGVVHKVSQGSGFRDRFWPTCLQWCQQSNFPVLGYHWITMDDPASQAQNWLGNNGGANVMFDFEDVDDNNNPTLNIGQFWACVDAFNAADVNVQLNYLPQWYWSRIGTPDLSTLGPNGILLVSSAYPQGYTSGYASALYQKSGGDSGGGWAPYGGATPSAWQFTSSAIVSGFNRVDCNAYLGTDINALFGTTRPGPPSTASPHRQTAH